MFIASYLSAVVYDLPFSNGSENIFKMNLLVTFCFPEILDMIWFCRLEVESFFEVQFSCPTFILKLSQVQNSRTLVDLKADILFPSIFPF